MRVIAVGFDELLMLKQVVQKALDGLLHLPREDREVTVTFRWTSNDWSVSVNSTNSNQSYSTGTPQGVSMHKWIILVSEELRNHLISGNRFIVEEWMHGDEPNNFVLPLTRV